MGTDHLSLWVENVVCYCDQNISIALQSLPYKEIRQGDLYFPGHLDTPSITFDTRRTCARATTVNVPPDLWPRIRPTDVNGTRICGRVYEEGAPVLGGERLLPPPREQAPAHVFALRQTALFWSARKDEHVVMSSIAWAVSGPGWQARTPSARALFPTPPTLRPALPSIKDKQAEAALKKKMEELSSCVQKYHVELTETLQRMSVQQEDSARMSKQELEQWYRTQLEEAKAAAAKDAETLTETRDALLQSETLVGHLSDEIDMLRSQNSSLSKQLQEAEKAVDENTVKYEENIRVLETELQALKEDTATQIMEIVHHVMSLTNARVALDLQMDSYFDILGKRKSDTTEADTVKKQKSLVLPALPIAEDNRVPMDTSDACAQDCLSDENANTSPIMADEVAAGSGH
uniref:IF rod domain-containing protein n=1 Tax=Branchiostoma floridae TaxID=7739 RepID=C3YXL0_BRAFL|eukprot:XP_002598807.1 hypothetical protein BRAFLDRAFT_74516 [Branchiostoma floridae]